VNLRLCQDLVNATRLVVSGRPGRTSPPDSTQRIRRSTSRGAVPSTSSPRTEGWPRTATYHPASSPMPSVERSWLSTLEPSLSPPFPVRHRWLFECCHRPSLLRPTAVRGEPWQRQRQRPQSFPRLTTKRSCDPNQRTDRPQSE
jgi:hypothetical protein